jgi:hypothetical protein
VHSGVHFGGAVEEVEEGREKLEEVVEEGAGVVGGEGEAG